MAITKKDLEQENAKLKEHLEATGQKIATLESAIAQSQEQDDKDAIAQWEDDLHIKGANDSVIPVEINRMVFKDSAIADSVGGMLFIEGNRIDGLQGIIDYKVSVPAIGTVHLLTVIRDEDNETIEVNIQLGQVTVSNFVIDRAIAAELLSELEAKEIKALEKEVKIAWCGQYRVDIAIDQATKKKDKELAKRDRRAKLAKKFGTRK